MITEKDVRATAEARTSLPVENLFAIAMFGTFLALAGETPSSFGCIPDWCQHFPWQRPECKRLPKKGVDKLN